MTQVTQTKAQAMLEQERTEAASVIDVTAFVEFVRQYYGRTIGYSKRAGRRTTLEEEIGEIGRILYRQYAREVKNYYHVYTAFHEAELSDEERQAAADRRYISAAKKTAYLSARSKDLTGEPFLKEHYLISDPAVARRIANAFEFVLRNYKDMLK